MQEFKLGKRMVGESHPCFIIAEVSANHQQRIENAKAIIEAAHRAGADAIKMQTYTPDTITIDSDKPWFRVGGTDNPEIWTGKTFYQLYQEAYTPWDWFPELKKLSENLGMEFFTSVFDDTAVDFMEKIGAEFYKIASYEATDIILLKKIASTKKPVIMSVGFATLDEIEFSVSTLREYGTKDLALLQCTTSYTKEEKPESTNLRTMLDLRNRFGVVCGFSDNMGGIEIPALSAAMGASIIEKHVVVEHDPSILDDQFSLDEKDLKIMIDKIRLQEKVMGKVVYGPQTKAEEDNRRYRRSLFVVKDMKQGEVFTFENMRSIRPADGLETRYYDDVIGKTAKQDIERGTPLAWKFINR